MKKNLLYFLLGSILLISACKKDKDEPEETTKADFFKATIDGSTVEYTYGKNSYDISQGYNSGYDYLQSDKNLTATIIVDVDTKKDGAIVEIGHLPSSPYAAESATFYALFTSGNQLYYTGNVERNGYVIHWYDSSGKEWSTELGNQSSSVFNITKVTKKQQTLADDKATITATFNATLYDGLGNSKSISNGSLQMTFRNF